MSEWEICEGFRIRTGKATSTDKVRWFVGSFACSLVRTHENLLSRLQKLVQFTSYFALAYITHNKKKGKQKAGDGQPKT